MRLSIDDFGTGHSSLSYLQRLPADTLKIDQSFIRDIKNAGDRPPLVESIIKMAHALSMETVAEGVETLGQLEALTAMGCDVLQGFLLSRPVPPEGVFEATQAYQSILAVPACEAV